MDKCHVSEFGEPPFVKEGWMRTNADITPDWESATMEAFGHDTDVNEIVARFERTGMMPTDPRGIAPQFGDVTELQGDLTELINRARGVMQEATDFASRWKPAEPAPIPAPESVVEPAAS